MSNGIIGNTLATPISIPKKSIQYWQPNTLYKKGQVVYAPNSVENGDSFIDAIWECSTAHTSDSHFVSAVNGIVRWERLGNFRASYATKAQYDDNNNVIHETYATKSEIESKADKTTIINSSSSFYQFEFIQLDNCEVRLGTAEIIPITILDGEYSELYMSGLSFDSGETPTAIDYTDSGILNWVGTDCTTSDGLSIFQPSANTHYDIVFYFNGKQFVGLVNGFVPATGNEAV